MVVRQKKGLNGFHHGAHSAFESSRDNPSAIKGPKPVDAVNVARAWLDRGVMPVPLAPRSKAPRGGRGWNSYRADPQSLDRFFKRGDNVGGLWGEPSGWIVDIDLDSEESVAAAKVLLPKTFVYGRRNAQFTHYLYTCEGISSHKYQTKEEGTVVEIRATGTQSVLPPSRHPTGDLYQIQQDIDITRLSKARLQQLVSHVAAAALGAKFWPAKGSRHDYIHAFCGGLCHAGWQQPEVEQFMGALMDGAQVRGRAREAHEETVRNTCVNFQKGNRVAGWPTLSQWVSGNALGRLKEWLGWKTSQLEAVPDEVDEPIIKVIPEHLLAVPGLVGEIAAWNRGKSFKQQPLFDLAVGLASVALLTQNRYLVAAWDTPLQPYFLLIAPTAGGKDRAHTAITEIASQAGLESTLFAGFQSYHAMMDKVSSPPHMAMWLWDEAARKLRTASRSQGSQDYQLLTYLMSLYGKANTVVAGMPGRKQEIPAIKYPFFSVVATAQPSALLEAMTDSDLSLGLVNRFILMDTGAKAPTDNVKRQTFMSSKLLHKIQEFARTSHKRGEFTPIQYGSALAYSLFRDFERECSEKCADQHSGVGAEVWGRANQNALILAGLVTVGIQKERPQIQEETAKWAIEFMRFTSQTWAERVDRNASRSEIEKGSKFVERLVMNVREYKGKCGERSGEVALVNRGIMPRSLLLRICRHLRTKDLEDIIQNLIVSDILGTSEEERMQVYWIKH